ncbi:hypothetical protein PUR61_16625, partial [Streptomyces sp. BE20]|uniref:hypothetical protein n=1 Tax=Streptomyces sp. BE20 TaxID=3002525 RepID=UPI002E763778
MTAVSEVARLGTISAAASVFLGYEISIAGTNRRTRRPSGTDRRNRRSLNGTVVLHVPPSVIKAKSA